MKEERKALLITIGVDTTTKKIHGKHRYINGGFRAPLWQDGQYEYMPIPEIKWNGRYVEDGEITFGNALGDRLNKPLLGHIPLKFRKELKNVAIHKDPDFKSLTYGDGIKTTRRGKTLTKLKSGDFLVFCPSLENYETGDRGRFIIGYFTVENVYNFKLKDDEFEEEYGCTREEIIKKYKDKNAHFSASFARAWDWSREKLLNAYMQGKERDLVLVTGKKGQSGLLNKAIRITKPKSGKYFIIPENYFRTLDFNSIYFHRGWKWVEGKRQFKALLSLLEKGEGFI